MKKFLKLFPVLMLMAGGLYCEGGDVAIDTSLLGGPADSPLELALNVTADKAAGSDATSIGVSIPQAVATDASSVDAATMAAEAQAAADAANSAKVAVEKEVGKADSAKTVTVEVADNAAIAAKLTADAAKAAEEAANAAKAAADAEKANNKEAAAKAAEDAAIAAEVAVKSAEAAKEAVDAAKSASKTSDDAELVASVKTAVDETVKASKDVKAATSDAATDATDAKAAAKMADEKGLKDKDAKQGEEADSAKKEKDEKSEEVSLLDVSIDIAGGKWLKGTESVWTEWADQPLKVNLKNISKAGWYRVAVEAKNINGPLPDFYKYFTLSLYNETTGKYAGGVSVKASDSEFQKGSALIYLDPQNGKDETLVLKWINDAYKENTYDANIEIKSVAVWYSKKKNLKEKLRRNAFQYTELNGKFFWDEKSIYTYWPNQTITFNFPKLESGKYEVEIWAKNIHGPLPKKFENFDVMVEADGVSEKASVKADDNEFQKGSVVLDLTGGDTDVRITWINDEFKKDSYDTNIEIKQIRLKKIGDSKRSALAAYLLGNKTGNKVLMGGIFILLTASIVMISLYNRRRARVRVKA